jgi:hypothetical protein
MRFGLTILVTVCSLTLVFGTELIVTNSTDSTVRILVLPPFDEIANAGVSPDIRKIIESALIDQGQLTVISFPFKELMGVPYQMVFDKKYCKPILDKVECDIIIMSQIITDNQRKPGVWPWSYKIRVYNAQTGKQLNSIQGENLKAEDIQGDIRDKTDKLIKDVGQTFKIW